MSRKPGERDKCECGVQLEFRTNLRTGKLVPLETKPVTCYVLDPNGVHCHPVEAHVTSEGEQFKAANYLNHFVTCPLRDKFRRDR